VKHEDVYLKEYGAVDEGHRGLEDYLGFYNTDRAHEALGYRTPAEVHFGRDGKSNSMTGVNKKEKEAKRKQTLLLYNATLKN
jgi:putative transposase